MVMHPECPCEKHAPIGKWLLQILSCAPSAWLIVTLCVGLAHRTNSSWQTELSLVHMTTYVNLCYSCCMHPGWLHGFWSPCWEYHTPAGFGHPQAQGSCVPASLQVTFEWQGSVSCPTEWVWDQALGESVARVVGGGIQALAMPSLMLLFTCSLMGSRFIMRMRWGHYGQTFPWAGSQGTVNSGVSGNLFRPSSTVLPTQQYMTYLLLPCYRLTVVCSFSNSDASLTVKVDHLSPPPSSVNQGSLSLVLLSYPGKAGSVGWGSIWSLWRGRVDEWTVLVYGLLSWCASFLFIHAAWSRYPKPVALGQTVVVQPAAVKELETLFAPWVT